MLTAEVEPVVHTIVLRTEVPRYHASQGANNFVVRYIVHTERLGGCKISAQGQHIFLCAQSGLGAPPFLSPMPMPPLSLHSHPSLLSPMLTQPRLPGEVDPGSQCMLDRYECALYSASRGTTSLLSPMLMPPRLPGVVEPQIAL